MKLNNKGFAITGILYTLFILFLLILVSVLSGLSIQKNMLEQSVASQEDSFIGTSLNAEQINEIIDKKTATVTGKYIFNAKEELTGKEIICTAYLKKDTSLNNGTANNITYIPNDCNEYEEKLIFTVTEVYSFEKE